jgi:hypothetical protein
LIELAYDGVTADNVVVARDIELHRATRAVHAGRAGLAVFSVIAGTGNVYEGGCGDIDYSSSLE